MLRKGLILGFVLGVMVLSTKAQQTGVVEVSRDTLIAILQNFRAEHEINPTATRTVSLGPKVVDKSKASRVKRKGFRVQIYSGSNRNDAYAAQSRFRSQYTDMDSYINYEEPNYRVKVGDFTSRTEANNFMRVLRSQYSSVFVFQEDIWVWE
ncbi:SPOR domain-containing protein [Sphingobacterium tabacisoli]|uniref:SPOR domain-containing protein n=1 Tax=Sphingobacterium tabacisoli TaxID=2044855 RepID=A0ABW5KWA4_9SPHI|nr:SPOR domain-containing protein [Sphingobacterium tabacisoli]